MTSTPLMQLMAGAITLLALADGGLHFALDFVLYGGKLWGAPSFPLPRVGAVAPYSPPGATPRRLVPFPSRSMSYS